MFEKHYKFFWLWRLRDEEMTDLDIVIFVRFTSLIDRIIADCVELVD